MLAALWMLCPAARAVAQQFPLMGWRQVGEAAGGESAEGESAEGEDEAEEIETDRDSFTPATSTTPFGRVIFESAWSSIDNRAVPDTNSLPEIVTRYGVNDWFELRLGWNWEAAGRRT